MDQSTSAPRDASDPARYRSYLASVGYAEPGNRVVHVRELDLGECHFFAYDDAGLRLKLALTPQGVVRPGLHPEDDWLGLLSSTHEAMTVSQRVAWLETQESRPVHGLPSPPLSVLAPELPRPVVIDPALWSQVTAPSLQSSADGGAIWIAWLQPSGARVPERWTVSARPGAPASILREPAALGSDERTDGAARARRLLTSGTPEEREWALLQIRETGDRAALPELSALLSDSAAKPELRSAAAGTLAALADPAAVAPLRAALRADADLSVRRAAAQALGRIPGATSLQALTAVAATEQVPGVRIEIVHALAAQGPAAKAALTNIAHSDADASVRDLARSYAAR